MARKNFDAGRSELLEHPMFEGVARSAWIVRHDDDLCPDDGWAVGTPRGEIHLHPSRNSSPDEWVYILAHALLHLGLGHFQVKERPWEWNVACDCMVARFLAELKLGRPPAELRGSVDCPQRTEEALYREFCLGGIPEHLLVFGTGGRGRHDMLSRARPSVWVTDKTPDHGALLSAGIASAVRAAIDIAGGVLPSERGQPADTAAHRARRWFIDHYPLLGALAAGFEIIQDRAICARMDIQVAAVWDQTREVYFNPTASLSAEEYRFVMAHELLHVGLRHGARCQGRDPLLWNIACDFVVNGWLVEMGVGSIPRCSGLYDPDLKGESAEAIYDRVVQNIRRYRKLATFRGKNLPDILPESRSSGLKAGDGIDLDEFCRRCLEQGLLYHEEQGRGYLPAGLVEEIRALSQPPIGWDVKLARWFDEHFRPVEKTRTYARPSRRQASTPDIPRPRWIEPDDVRASRTYGVVLDTSGSMDRAILAKALGAIASYSVSRDVIAARLVFCDAVAYDHGYVAPEDIAGKVKVRGRGGTVLQPGIALLEKAADFPKNAPILIITDGMCDHVRTTREHAFLLPAGASLPFTPRGEVFRIS
jgi:predicted metal-dependent peptidase